MEPKVTSILLSCSSCDLRPLLLRPGAGGARARGAHGSAGWGSGRWRGAPPPQLRAWRLGGALRPRPRRRAAVPALPLRPAGAPLH